MNSRILIALFSVVAVSACVAEDPGSMFIQGNQRITRQQQCAPQAAQGGSQQVFMTVGTMDLLQTDRYVAYMVVGSRLPNIATATGKENEDLQIEVNEITITGAWVTYRIDGLQGSFNGNVPVDSNNDGVPELEANLSVPESVFVPTSAFLSNGNNAVVAFEVVSSPVGKALDADKAFDTLYAAGYLSAEIVLEGYMTDGTEVHSTPFTYPIKVCRGCLVSYNMDPPECCTFTEQATYVPCFPGQDEASPCTVACDVLRGTVRETEKRAMLLGETTTLAAPAEPTE